FFSPAPRLPVHFLFNYAPPGRRVSAMRSARRRATASFSIVGQVSTALSVTKWMVLRSPPKVPLAGPTSVASIQSQPFLGRLARGVGRDVLGCGGEAHHGARAAVAGLRERREDVGVFGQRQRGRAAAVFLQFLLRRLGCPPIGDRGGADGDLDRKRAL